MLFLVTFFRTGCDLCNYMILIYIHICNATISILRGQWPIRVTDAFAFSSHFFWANCVSFRAYVDLRCVLIPHIKLSMTTCEEAWLNLWDALLTSLKCLLNTNQNAYDTLLMILNQNFKRLVIGWTHGIPKKYHHTKQVN